MESFKMFLATFFQLTFFCLCDVRCPTSLSGTIKVFNCYCYQFSAPENKIPWNNEVCSKQGGTLVNIKTKEVNEFLKATAATLYRNVNYGVWIGARDVQEEGKWKWTDSDPVTFSDWAVDEPNDAFLVEQDCGYMKKIAGWSWGSIQCEVLGPTHPYICQFGIPNCTSSELANQGVHMSSGIVAGIVIGAIVGIILLGFLGCWLVVGLKSFVSKCDKRKKRGTSSTTGSKTEAERTDPGETEDLMDNDLNEALTRSRVERWTMNVKDTLTRGVSVPPTSGLTVDLTTGRATVKNPKPSTYSKGDNVSTRSLKSFVMDVESQRASSPSSSMDDNGLQSNLDNVSKPTGNTKQI